MCFLSASVSESESVSKSDSDTDPDTEGGMLRLKNLQGRWNINLVKKTRFVRVVVRPGKVAFSSGWEARSGKVRQPPDSKSLEVREQSRSLSVGQQACRP